jgi:hypothetical protein
MKIKKRSWKVLGFTGLSGKKIRFEANSIK